MCVVCVGGGVLLHRAAGGWGGEATQRAEISWSRWDGVGGRVHTQPVLSHQCTLWVTHHGTAKQNRAGDSGVNGST